MYFESEEIIIIGDAFNIARKYDIQIKISRNEVSYKSKGKIFKIKKSLFKIKTKKAKKSKKYITENTVVDEVAENSNEKSNEVDEIEIAYVEIASIDKNDEAVSEKTVEEMDEIEMVDVDDEVSENTVEEMDEIEMVDVDDVVSENTVEEMDEIEMVDVDDVVSENTVEEIANINKNDEAVSEKTVEAEFV